MKFAVVMVAKVVETDGEKILYCLRCNIPLQMAEYRSIYCVGCQQYNLINHRPTKILCCVECDNPLRVTDWVVPPRIEEIEGLPPESEGGYGSYCEHCKFHPSMQDTFLKKIKARTPQHT